MQSGTNVEIPLGNFGEAVRAAGKVAQASAPASQPGVPPSDVSGVGGGTPPELAGADACATLSH